MKLEHIVLTTDLSDESFRPCEDVAGMAKQNDSNVTLLHVISMLSVAPHGAPLAPPVQELGIEERIAKAEKALAERAKDLPWDLKPNIAVIAAEKVGEGVNKWAHEHGANLIALSTHGRTGFRRFVLGSMAEAILRHSEVPVLAFPDKRG